MRRIGMVALAVAVSVISLVGESAYAEKQNIDGRGDIAKLVANNGQTAVTARVTGLGRPCGGAQYLNVMIKNRNGRLLYTAEGSCIQAEWYTGLFYTSTGAPEDATQVRCPRLGFQRVPASGAFVVEVPRACLDNAPDRIKLDVDGANYGTMTGGHAGPTRLLDRG